jgi:thiosulfate dehydrogenase (quinone) large subunit
MWSVHGRDGTVATGWVLMPLRLFLGVTFLFAGLQKLANPDFFRRSSLFGIHAQLAAAARSSPIHGLVSHLVSSASAVGLVISLGEVAIGVGILAGLWMRVAAVAGMALSFGLFLTVSFHATPYFTGSDIVFLFAWTPVALAGAGGAPALDTWLADRRPVTDRRPVHLAGAGEAGAVPRRTVLSRGALTGITAAVVVGLGGVVAALGRAVSGTTPTGGGASALTPPTASTDPTTPTTGSPTSTSTGATGSTTPTTSPPGTPVGTASQVPVGGSATFTDPTSGDPALVIQQPAGEFLAFDAICPHEGCTVAYAPSARIIACPCHGSEFNARTGALIRGPAARGLEPIRVIKGADGDLYVPT